MAQPHQITIIINAEDEIDAMNKGESMKRFANLFKEKDLNDIVSITEAAVVLGKKTKSPMAFLEIGKKLVAFFTK